MKVKTVDWPDENGEAEPERKCELIVFSGDPNVAIKIQRLIEDGYDIDTALRVNDSTVHYVLIRYKEEPWKS